MITPQTLVAKTSSLISFPGIALRLNEVLANEDASLNDAVAVLQNDPALTSRLLKLANSAMMGGQGNIDSLSMALTRIGIRQVRELVMGMEVSRSFNGLPNELISVEDFWRHSLYCAVISRRLADRCRIKGRDSAFTAGLLHDIGHLVLFSQQPDASRRFLRRSLDESDGLNNDDAERKELGFDHGEVGLEMARQWQFPESLQLCIYAHHRPPMLASTPPLVWLVHIANSLAVMAELDSLDFDAAPPIEDEAWKVLDMSIDDVPSLLGQAKKETEELLELFI